MIPTAVIDFGLCNIDSMLRALADAGARPFTVRDPENLLSADRLVIPGVGTFPDAMESLNLAALPEAIRDFANRGRPVLGVCLGMQLLASQGTEVSVTPGLGLIPGEVIRLKPAEGERIPHIGWNEVNVIGEGRLFDQVPAGADFYFVHSYHLVPVDPGDLLATTPYAGGFGSAVQRGSITGVQFHPEKSQRWGRLLLDKFVNQ